MTLPTADTHTTFHLWSGSDSTGDDTPRASRYTVLNERSLSRTGRARSPGTGPDFDDRAAPAGEAETFNLSPGGDTSRDVRRGTRWAIGPWSSTEFEHE